MFQDRSTTWSRWAPLLAVLLLVPIAQLLRTQNPWTCFPLTFDESFFAQAIDLWSKGEGLRIASHAKVLEPTITAGLPLAWGTALVRLFAHDPVSHAARLFVHFSFYATLALVGVTLWRRSRSAWAIALGWTLVSFLFSKLPAGGYVTYGVLGEMPALFLALLALLAADRGRWVSGAVLVAAAYATKPTFVFLAPALVLAQLAIGGRRAALKVAGALAVAFAFYLGAVAAARGESPIEYLNVLIRGSVAIALVNPSGHGLWDYHRQSGGAFSALVGLALVIWAAFKFRQKGGARRPSEWAALLFFFANTFVFLVTSRAPVPKQWLLVLLLPAIALVLDAAPRLGLALRASWPKAEASLTLPLLLVICVVWAINVPSLGKRAFGQTSIDACPAKEQREIGARLSQASPTGAGVEAFIDTGSQYLFLYELGPQVSYREEKLDGALTRARWVTGTMNRLEPAPSRCAWVFRGSQFGLLDCGEAKESAGS